MTITAYQGPLVAYGITLTSSASNGLTGGDAEHNPQRGPSYFDLWGGLLDPRVAYNYDPSQGISTPMYGFIHGRAIVDFVPSSASSNAFTISSNTAPSAGAAVTLTPSSAKGTYLTTIVAPENGQTVSVIAIDSTASTLNFGSDANVYAWNPAAGTGRCISITTSSSGDVGSWTIAGRDMYGYKMTETIATSSVAFVTQKAFKYLNATGAITASSVIASTGVSIGLSDTFGFPMKASYLGYNLTVQVLPTAYSSITTAAVLSSALVILASTVATQTSTTPDVRGTYASSTATNGTVRIQIVATPTPQALASVTSTDVSPLFGGVQYSSI